MNFGIRLVDGISTGLNVEICDVARMIALFIEYELWDKVSIL